VLLFHCLIWTELKTACIMFYTLFRRLLMTVNCRRSCLALDGMKWSWIWKEMSMTRFKMFVLFFCFCFVYLSYRIQHFQSAVGFTYLLHSAEMVITNRSWKSMVLNYSSVIRQITALWRSQAFVYLSFWWS